MHFAKVPALFALRCCCAVLFASNLVAGQRTLTQHCPGGPDGRVGIIIAEVGGEATIVEIVEGLPASRNRYVHVMQRILGIAEGGVTGKWEVITNVPLGQVAAMLMGKTGSVVALKLRDNPPVGQANVCIVELRRSIETDDVSTVVSYDGGGTTARDSHASTNTMTATAARCCRQPDYRAWSKLKIGMDEAEVTKLLGPPVIRLSGGQDDGIDILEYGSICRVSQVLPYEPSFRIGCQQGKAIFIEDPFNGVFSLNGVPSTPVLISPANHQSFNHYPRVLDLRWYPVSGVQDLLKYEIQCDIESDNGWEHETMFSTEPFVSILFGGTNRGRWKVRAQNNVGQGDWSEFRYFSFTR